VQCIVVTATIEQIIAAAARDQIAATATAHHVIASAALDHIGTILAIQDIGGGTANQRIIAIAALHEHTAATTADQHIIPAPAPGRLDFGIPQMQQDTTRADHLHHIIAGTAMDVMWQVIGIDDQHIVTGTSVKRITARTTGQPVIIVIAMQDIVAIAASGIVHTLVSHMDRFSAIAGGIRTQAAGDGIALSSHLCATAVGNKGAAMRIEQKIRRNHFLALAVLQEAAARQYFIAIAYLTALHLMRQIDTRDTQFIQTLQFRQFNGIHHAIAIGIIPALAIMIGINPHLDVMPVGIKRIEYLIGMRIETLERIKTMRKRFAAGFAVLPGNTTKILRQGFTDVIDLAIAVAVHDDDPIFLADPAGLFQTAAIIIGIEQDRRLGITGQPHAIAIEIKHQRIGRQGHPAPGIGAVQDISGIRIRRFKNCGVPTGLSTALRLLVSITLRTVLPLPGR